MAMATATDKEGQSFVSALSLSPSSAETSFVAKVTGEGNKERAKTAAGENARSKRSLVVAVRQKIEELRRKAGDVGFHVVTIKNEMGSGKGFVVAYQKSSAEIRAAIQRLRDELKVAQNAARAADPSAMDGHDHHHDDHHDDEIDHLLSQTHTLDHLHHYAFSSAVLHMAQENPALHETHGHEIKSFLESSLSDIIGGEPKSGRSLDVISRDYKAQEPAMETLGFAPVDADGSFLHKIGQTISRFLHRS